VIGTGGKVIREIVAKTGAKVDIDDEGMIKISSSDVAQIEAAKNWILGIVEEAEVGKIYTGKVVNIVDFGAFVNFMGGKDGLVHVSEMKNERVEKPPTSSRKARKSRSRSSRSTTAARCACRCASSIRKPAASWRTPVPLAKPREPRGDRPDRGDRGDRRGPRGGGDRGRGGDRGPRREGRGDREGGNPDHMPAFLKSDD
jgi:polyribonucleotide nucleotidyltransferase